METRPESPEIKATIARYKEAYVVTITIVGFASLIKGFGIVSAAIIVFLSVLIIFNSEQSGFFQMGVPGIVFGLLVGALLYFLGVLVSAVGQILQGVVDTAVNTSPLLTNLQRSEAMSLNRFTQPQIDPSENVQEARPGWRCLCKGFNPESITKCQYCGRDMYASR